MRSSGGVIGAEEAAAHPALVLVSGPAAGTVGAGLVAQRAGIENAIAFDMGGTSTDVSLVVGGTAERTSERTVGGFPIRLPMVDIHTVGAGGGSIVWRDAGGALRAGPESAGAMPGPACYGNGGTRPTVTDANLLLGRLPATLAGGLELDNSAAEEAFAGIDPHDAIEIVNAEMLRALRVVSVERGHDPGDFALVAFGGAGPLHACALAEELGIDTVLVPGAAGVLSAWGSSPATSAATPCRVRLSAGRRAAAPGGRRGGSPLPRPVLRADRAARPRLAERFHRAHEERYGVVDATGRSSSSPYGRPRSRPARRWPSRPGSRSRPPGRPSSSSTARLAGFPPGGWGLGMGIPRSG